VGGKRGCRKKKRVGAREVELEVEEASPERLVFFVVGGRVRR
jgi:hypothetical protein